MNLEPVDDEKVLGERSMLPKGRCASVETAKKAIELGFDYILLIGNPGTGVMNDKIIEIMQDIKKMWRSTYYHGWKDARGRFT